VGGLLLEDESILVVGALSLLLSYCGFLHVDSFHAPGQAEVANLNRAVVVDKNVAGLEVSVDNLAAVQIG